MGDRGNIKIEFGEEKEIYFYSHWGGSDLPETLQAALERGKGRWSDDSYLARIIFSEMIKDQVLEETGFGICPYEAGDNEHDVLIVNIPKQQVIRQGDKRWTAIWTFEEFVNLDIKTAFANF